MHSSIKKKKWGALLYILFTFLLIKTKLSKIEVNKHTVRLFKEKQKKKNHFFFQLYTKSLVLMKSFIGVKPRLIKSSFEIQTQGNWDRSNAMILVERRPIQYIQRSWIVNSYSCYSQRVWINSISMKIRYVKHWRRLFWDTLLNLPPSERYGQHQI